MLTFLKNYIRKKIISVIYAEQSGLKQFIFEQGREASYNDVLLTYRQKYTIAESFRFNGKFILFYGDGEIMAGADSYISDYSMLQAYKGCRISIGKKCMISSNVRIFTQSADADGDFSKSIKDKTGNVHIGDYVWIGANVLINPGITIGDNSVIGANSMVTKDVPANVIYGGVPAKLIRKKNNGL